MGVRRGTGYPKKNKKHHRRVCERVGGGRGGSLNIMVSIDKTQKKKKSTNSPFSVVNAFPGPLLLFKPHIVPKRGS